jgi:hypothetical protein
MQTLTPLQWLGLIAVVLVCALMTVSLLLNVFNGEGRQRLYALVALLVIAGVTIKNRYPGYMEVRMESIMGFLVFFCIPAYFIYRFIQKRQHSAAVEAAPEQPFKVNIAVVPMQDGALTKLARGRRMTQMLEMDVKIGIKDWQRIKDAGLYDAVLASDRGSRTRGTCPVR